MNKQNQWLTRKDVAKALGVTERHSFITAPFGEIERHFEQGEASGAIKVADMTVRWQRHGKSYYVSPSSMKAFEAQFALKPRAGKDHLSKDALALSLGISPTHTVVRQTWQRIREQFDQGVDDGTVEINGQTIEWRSFYSDRNVKLPFINRGSLDAFRAALDAEPERATGDELSLSRLAAMLSVDIHSPLVRRISSLLDEDIADGKTEGVTRIGDVEVPWRLVKAVWGGSSKYGGVSPHVHMSAVEGLSKELEGHKPVDLAKEDLALEIGVEEVREIALNVSWEGKNSEIVYSKAIVTARGNLLFEVGGHAHLLVGHRDVLRAFEEDGEVIWERSKFLQGHGGIGRVERSENEFSPDQAIKLVADDPVNRWEVAKALGMTPRHSLIHAVFGGIDNDVKNGHSFGSVRIGSTVFPWIRRKMPHGGSYAPLLPSSAISALLKIAESRPMATDDYLSRESLFDELGEKGSMRFLVRLWATIGTEAERGPDRGILLVDGNPVSWRYLYTTTGSRFPYISKASIPALRQALVRDVAQVSIDVVESPLFAMLDAECRNNAPPLEIAGEEGISICITQPDGSLLDRQAIPTKDGNYAIIGGGSIKLAKPDGIVFEQYGNSWRRATIDDYLKPEKDSKSKYPLREAGKSRTMKVDAAFASKEADFEPDRDAHWDEHSFPIYELDVDGDGDEDDHDEATDFGPRM